MGREWRDSQVWIGGRRYGPQGAMFMPPHRERIPTAITDIVAFAGRDDIQALVHAALVHAQFETIHPFPDGNGPIRRAIIHALLRHRIPHVPARSQLGHRSGTPCCCTRQFRSAAVRT